MANAVYDKARRGFLNSDINWTNDAIKMALVDTDVEMLKSSFMAFSYSTDI